MTKEPISLRESLEKAVAIHDAAVNAGVTDPKRVAELLHLGAAVASFVGTRQPVPHDGPRFAKILDGDKHIMTADHVNGLVWDVADFGGKRMTLDEAQKACAALRTGGHADWRLPTIQELLGLVDYERHEPAIDKEFFPNTSTDYYYRTSTPYAPHSGYAWGVSFHDGGSYGLGHGHDNYVRAVRASECPHAVGYRDMERAWQRARKNKLPSANQMAFEADWAGGLLDLAEQLNAGTWLPRPTTCFIAKRPKAREIHAPDFSDRIVHHWLVPQLEAIWEPKFAQDSFSNRPGKGTHAAVDRLQGFVREVRSGQGGGWYLQLDVKNFFNTVNRPVLWAMLKRGMAKAGAPPIVQRTVHALLRRSPLQQGVLHRSTPAEHARVPAHKRLANAAPGCGLPIGNLSSQFFANVYLDALDQFVKHKLKAPRYLRYVDDFILVHESREQLQAWLIEIERFLRETLKLELKADIKLKPLASGADFLGYHVFATHRRIRPRVVHHAFEKLIAWERRHVRGRVARATPEQFRLLRSITASYWGHFSHGNAFRLTERMHRRFRWLEQLTNGKRRFDYRLEGRVVAIEVANAA